MDKKLTVTELDQRDADALVQAAEIAIQAVESIRSRMTPTRDATSATGHVLDALVHLDGTLREYDRRTIWALRHALGAESSAFHAPHDAAANVLAALIQGLRPAKTDEERARKVTAQEEIEAIAKVLVRSQHSIESIRGIEQWDAGQVQARAQAAKRAHEDRLARAAKGTMHVASAAPPAAPKPPASKPKAAREPSLEGDYPLTGSVDAGGTMFPTSPTV